MSGNGKRSLTPIAPSGFSRFHREKPANEGVDRLYNLARFQGVIEIVRVRRAAVSIQGPQSAVRLENRTAQAGHNGRHERRSRLVYRARGFAHRPTKRPPKPLGGLSLRGCAKWISRALARGDPVASACIQ
jgi:hypothetical protein